MDGPGMINPGIGLPEEVQGLWISSGSPQWSLRVESDMVHMDYYGSSYVSFGVRNYGKFSGSESYDELQDLDPDTITADWPCDDYEKFMLDDIRIQRDRITLTLKFDDTEQRNYGFSPAPEGYTLLTEPLALPEDAVLTGLKYHTAGSMMGPYYSIRQTEDGYQVRTGPSEIYWEEMDGDEEEETTEEELQSLDGSSVVTVPAEEVEAMVKILLQYNVLAWNGFDKSVSAPPGVMDMDDSFSFAMTFSDGTRVSARGYNALPPNSADITRVMSRFFLAHEDYARYYPPAFPDSPVTRMTMAIPTYATDKDEYFRAEFTPGSGRWIFSLQDPEGTFLEKGTNVYDYGDAQEPLPVDLFLELLKKYGFEQLNSEEDQTAFQRQYMEIMIYFENGQRFQLTTGEYPENYEEFRSECVPLMYDVFLHLSEGAPLPQP